ncbi:hypothetical protein EYC84_008490 [Monilinia fructicola]|uniref:2EXR domain-containing protein n=1 Tax=Monilinia fructicola TaxID=38448 RepID=A0A5M9JER5_MONFR|nr:hypothetical protein EYC84_008490 [Monilinia fructicola]
MASLETFTLFTHLPRELQDQIWDYTLPGPRIMRVDYSPILRNGKYATSKTPDLYRTYPRSYGRQLPIALRVNQASRTYALSQLTARFRCYWNLNIDIPYVPARGYQKSAARYILSHLAESGLLDGFRNLAVDIEILNGNFSSPNAVESIHMCPDLTDLYLAYPSIGMWEDSEGPDNSKAWSLGPQSESTVGSVSRKSTMTRIPEDFLGYLKDDDRVALENSPGRISKLNIDIIIWMSMMEIRSL